MFIYSGVSSENREINPFLNPGLAVLLFSVHELITDDMINQAIMNPDVRVSLSLRTGFFRDPAHLRHMRDLTFDPEALKTCHLCGLILPVYYLSNVDQKTARLVHEKGWPCYAHGNRLDKFNERRKLYCEVLTDEGKVCKAPISEYFYASKYTFRRVPTQKYFQNYNLEFMNNLFEVLKNLKSLETLKLHSNIWEDIGIILKSLDFGSILWNLEDHGEARKDQIAKELKCLESFKNTSSGFLQNLQQIFEFHEKNYFRLTFQQYLRIQIKRLTELLGKLVAHQKYQLRVEGLLEDMETQCNEIIYKLKSE